MQLKLIEEKAERVRLIAEFRRHLRRNMKSIGTRLVGYQGGVDEVPFYCTEGFWLATADYTRRHGVKIPRAWNGFGFLADSEQQRIVVEINIATESLTRQVSGFFARDEHGKVHILHSGSLGGAVTGIGKNAFLAWSGEQLLDVDSDSGNPREGIPIAQLEAPDLLDRIRKFAEQVQEFKDKVRSGLLRSNNFVRQVRRWKKCREEFRGRITGKRRADTLDYIRYHGDIFAALKKDVESRRLRYQNWPADLIAYRGKKAVAAYEIKTDTSPGSLHSAIGQILVYTIDYPGIKKYLVLPMDEQISEGIDRCIGSLGIAIRRYKLSGRRVVLAPHKT